MMSAIGAEVCSTEAGDRYHDAGPAPLQEAEDGRTCPGMFGHLGRGESTGVRSDEALGTRQQEERHQCNRERGP